MQKCNTPQQIQTLLTENTVSPHNLRGIKPTYCWWGSGYLSLIVHTQQLGMTILLPRPREPYCHTTNWRYAAYRNCLLSSPGFGGSSRARTSFQILLARRRTPSLRIKSSTCGSREMQSCGGCPQHFLSTSVGISLHLMQVHHSGWFSFWPGGSGGGALAITSINKLGSLKRHLLKISRHCSGLRDWILAWKDSR